MKGPITCERLPEKGLISFARPYRVLFDVRDISAECVRVYQPCEC